MRLMMIQAAEAAEEVGKLQAVFDQVGEWVGTNIPNLVGALAILVIGWLLALVVAAAIRLGVRRTGLGARLARWTEGDRAVKGTAAERWVGKGAFYLIMLFVVVAFFQVLGLAAITKPLNRLLTEVFEFAPRVLGAALLLLIAWAVASVSRLIISRGLNAAKLDERLGSGVGIEDEPTVPVAKTLGDAVYWLIFLFFLPAVLGALALEGLLEPVQGMINKILGFLPNIFTAALILGVGWFLARVIQRIVANLLAAIGVDRLGQRVGVARVLGAQGLSGFLGLIIYILILVPVLVAALNALALEAITSPATNMLNAFLVALPAIFAAVLVLAIAYVVGRIVAVLITNLLTGAGFDSLIGRLGLLREPAEAEQTPSAIVGYLALVGIMLFAAIEAARLLGFAGLADLVALFLVFAGRVVVGLVVFAVGLYLANLVAHRVLATGTGQAQVLALAARASILVLAAAMALNQMGLATELINIVFGAALGAVAVALAIAVGLGGREIAARELDLWVRSLKSKKS